MTTHDTIKAPAPPNLSGLCWKEQDDPTKPHMFSHCMYRKGHLGLHEWEDELKPNAGFKQVKDWIK